MDAFATLLFNDNYLPGALQVGEALARHDPGVHRICLVTQQVHVPARHELGRFFQVRQVEVIEGESSEELKMLGRPELCRAFTKLHVFALTEYKRIIYLDADTLPLVSLAHLFDQLPLGAGIAAAPDIGWPDCFNSGVFVTEPSLQVFEQLKQQIPTSFDGSDQGLLNLYFKNWHRLSFTYNVTANAFYQYKPAYVRFKDDIKVLHFIGEQKPWTTSVAPQPEPEPAKELASQAPPAPHDYVPEVDESKLIQPSSTRWDPLQFEPPVASEPEAETFDERDSQEPEEFVFPVFGKPVVKFPWEGKTKPTRVFADTFST